MFKAASDLLDRDERSLKRRKLTTVNFHEILTPELLMQMAQTAREMEEYNQRKQQSQIGEEGVIDASALDDPAGFHYGLARLIECGLVNVGLPSVAPSYR